MAEQEQLGILIQGATIWNAWREQNQHISIDLSGADLYRADLSGVDLNGADLSRIDLYRANLNGANLTEADLNGADLYEADLYEADLRGANLYRADLNGADFSRANLSRANLSRADLSRADLSGADLSRAITNQTIFNDVDLRSVKGLETVQHWGPSGITTRTLERSEGDIPDLFLKGVGLSDESISYARSFLYHPIQYYTCFISYSGKDQLFAKQLQDDLRQKGVRCWFASEDMEIGDKIKPRIDSSIRKFDKLLLILSEHSISSSWVAYEVERALNKEPLGRPNVLYPIRVDQAILTCATDWARDIKETRYVGDFEQWTNPEKYQVSFQRLLRALRGKQEQAKS